MSYTTLRKESCGLLELCVQNSPQKHVFPRSAVLEWPLSGQEEQSLLTLRLRRLVATQAPSLWHCESPLYLWFRMGLTQHPHQAKKDPPWHRAEPVF